MIETVIFDMDGVIVNTEPLHYEVSQKQFEMLGIDVPRSEYETFTGNSNKNIYQKIKQQYDLTTSVDNLIVQKNQLFVQAFVQNSEVSLLSGVKDLIIELHDCGMQLLVASSSEHAIINLVFERFELERYFTHKISGEDFVNSKPDPAIFVKAVELSCTATNRCIVIEDSTNGIAAAKSAGLYCIGYQSSFAVGQTQAKADHIIYDFSELSYESIRNINY